jgi:hypothetical protein
VIDKRDLKNKLNWITKYTKVTKGEDRADLISWISCSMKKIRSEGWGDEQSSLGQNQFEAANYSGIGTAGQGEATAAPGTGAAGKAAGSGREIGAKEIGNTGGFHDDSGYQTATCR